MSAPGVSDECQCLVLRKLVELFHLFSRQKFDQGKSIFQENLLFLT